MKQISFCITCMNRLKHLQETLEKNILDNFLVDEVEFVVLDYNSQDGLEEWIAQSMMKYIEMGILSIIGLLNQLIIDAAIAGIWFSDWQKEK